MTVVSLAPRGRLWLADVLTGRDQDAGESSSLTFFIDGGGSGLPFSLATSGQFSVSGSLDYETTAK